MRRHQNNIKHIKILDSERIMKKCVYQQFGYFQVQKKLWKILTWIKNYCMYSIENDVLGTSLGPVAKTLHFQFREPGFSPWSGN